MPLFVRSLQTYVLDLSVQKTVNDVKTLVTGIENLPVEQMAVFYGRKPLNDICELSTFRDESTLYDELRLLRGNVHVSLARAGKFQGQISKFEKQQKKKTRTVRAKMRMLYNRRFVNVVARFLRKKGPNARS
jgi:ribosomal protein S30